MSRTFGPIPEGHPAIGAPCHECQKPIVAGDFLVLVPVGPADEEERKKLERGAAYTAVAELAHTHCRGITEAINEGTQRMRNEALEKNERAD